MAAEREHRTPFTSAGHAVAEQGLVLLDGPNGIAISMTPEAALRTGESLVEAAKAARQHAPDA